MSSPYFRVPFKSLFAISMQQAALLFITAVTFVESQSGICLRFRLQLLSGGAVELFIEGLTTDPQHFCRIILG